MYYLIKRVEKITFPWLRCQIEGFDFGRGTLVSFVRNGRSKPL